MKRGIKPVEVTIRAATVAQLLTRALAGATPDQLAGGKRSIAHVDAVLEQCGPDRATMTAARDMYAAMPRFADVVFDLPLPDPRDVPRRMRPNGYARTSEGRVACTHPGCPKTFAYRDYLTKHLRRHHGTRQRNVATGEHPCVDCGRTFTTTRGLKAHRQACPEKKETAA